MTNDLEKKIERAIKLIQSAGKIAKEHGQPLEICYSGGKDSDVILELAKMSGVEYMAIYKNTTIDPPYTIKHVREKSVKIMRPKENFYQLMCRKGFPSGKVRFCCGDLKEYKILDYAVEGIRKDESKKREERYQEPEQCRIYSNGDVRKYYPILDWSEKDVAEFVREKHIQCHPLYYDKKGAFHPERRLGCICCPLKSKRKRIADFRKYPNMVKLYCRAGEIYRNAHPNSPNIEEFESVYEWLTFTLFFKRTEDLKRRIGATLFDDGINCKQFLQDYFNVKL